MAATELTIEQRLDGIEEQLAEVVAFINEAKPVIQAGAELAQLVAEKGPMALLTGAMSK